MEDFDAALARAQEAVEVSEASGDQFGLAGALSVRAFVLEVQGNPEEAVPEIERALAISRSIGNFGLQGERGLPRHPAAHLAGALSGRAGRGP